RLWTWDLLGVECAELAVEVDERAPGGGHVKGADAADHDPAVAGGVRGVELALDYRERVVQRFGEAVGAGLRRPAREVGVLLAEHVDRHRARAPHATPRH